MGLTRSTDHLIAKVILGYRFDFWYRIPTPDCAIADESRAVASRD